MGYSLEELETSDLGRSHEGRAWTAFVLGLVAVPFLAWVWFSVVPSVIDAATARPAACAGYSAADCTALAQGDGW